MGDLSLVQKTREGLKELLERSPKGGFTEIKLVVEERHDAVHVYYDITRLDIGVREFLLPAYFEPLNIPGQIKLEPKLIADSNMM
jgi:hypothetical protein